MWIGGERLSSGTVEPHDVISPLSTAGESDLDGLLVVTRKHAHCGRQLMKQRHPRPLPLRRIGRLSIIWLTSMARFKSHGLDHRPHCFRQRQPASISSAEAAAPWRDPDATCKCIRSAAVKPALSGLTDDWRTSVGLLDDDLCSSWTRASSTCKRKSDGSMSIAMTSARMPSEADRFQSGSGPSRSWASASVGARCSACRSTKTAPGRSAS